MAETLGEKLRQAREDRGYTISEVSEHTRISPLYLESIENNDYSILPGGIFNKGFVKSYAKFVGINEQEALFEYASLISAHEAQDDGEHRHYRPEVLTDDAGSRSMVPTVIVALLVLGVMTAVILFGVNYLRRGDTGVSNQPTPANTNTAENSRSDRGDGTETKAVPDMDSLKVEFKARTEAVSLTSTVDGGKAATKIVEAGSSAEFEPRSSLKLSYSKSLANFVQLSINGKEIALPSEPLMPKRNVIEFEINKENLAQIWTNAAISSSVAPANAPLESNTSTMSNEARPTPQPKASVAEGTPAANPSPKTSVAPKVTPKPPPANIGKPVANRPQ
jgi:cytoskeletal protein RodZ